MTDPLRVLDDGSASPALRSLLESAKRTDDPRAGQIDALSARLAPLMVPPPASIPTAVASAGHAALAVKIAAAVTAVGLAGGGAWYVHESHAPAPVVAPPIIAVAPQPLPVPTPTPTAPTPPAPPEPAPRVVHHPIDTAAETKLVTAAEDALVHGDPATALARAREHATRFPSGAHAEERDRIAIEALVRLGKSDAAHAAVDQFFARYPSSIYRARLEALVK